MSTTSRHLCRTLIRLSNRPPTRRKCQSLSCQFKQQQQASPFRQFSTTPYRTAEQKSNEAQTVTSPDFEDSELQTPENPYTLADLDPTERAHYDSLSKPEQTRYLALQNHIKAITESEEFATLTEDHARRVAHEIGRTGLLQRVSFSGEAKNLATLRDNYWQEAEDDEFGQIPDGDDEVTEDMISSVAESELEVHREVREYTRIAAWDLPLLLQFTKPFEKPDTSNLPLRFRYTTYMGESHPAQRKVVVEFHMRNLAKAAGLSKDQCQKLKKLVGVRYNPETGVVKISCEKFENAAQNKRYLGDMVQKLIRETKEGKDTFADIPVDYRHHKFKRRVAFPINWHLVDQEDVNLLRDARNQARLLEIDEADELENDEEYEEEDEDEREIVDGRILLETHVASKSVQPSLTRPR